MGDRCVTTAEPLSLRTPYHEPNGAVTEKRHRMRTGLVRKTREAIQMVRKVPDAGLLGK